MSLSVPAQAPVRRVGSTGYGSRIGLAVMLAGIFVTVMDNSIVNVAIPSIRSTLGATFAEAELVVASYTFAFAVGLIPVAGSAISSVSDGCFWPVSPPSH
jgi:MFS family permease